MIQEGIAKLSEYIPLDDASLKIVICSLLSYPFAAIFKRLPDNSFTLKNLYVVVVSSFYIFGILDLRQGVITLLIASLGSYFITRYIKSPKMPWINFLFLMGHLAFNHLHTQFFVEPDPTKIDITGAQMVLVMKLTAFGWNIQDARSPTESLTDYNKSRVIKKHPNILPFLGYVFFFASVLTGPAFDYADYDKFIHSTLFDDVPQEKRPGKTRKRKIPKSGFQAGLKFLQGIFWAICLVVSGSYISLDVVFEKSWLQKSFIYKIFFLWILSITYRLKYYAIWLIAEGSCILCGIGYNGFDSKTNSFKWDRVQNIDPWTFETGQNVHTCLEAWNMNTNKWLKNYVYLRVAKKGKKPGFKSTLFTFVTSAFWHGTRPGYYLSFVMGALIQSLGKIYRKNFRPIFLKADGTPKRTKILYDIVCYIGTHLTFGYITQPFVILDFNKSIYLWSTVYFYVLIICFVTFFVFSGPFGNSAKKWCKSLCDKPNKEKTSDYSLNSEEKLKVSKAIENVEVNEADMPTLGLPSIEDLQNIDKKEVNQEMQEILEAWTSFKDRKQNDHNNDFDELKNAYNRFTEEINDIIHSQKKKFDEKSNSIVETKKNK